MPASLSHERSLKSHIEFPDVAGDVDTMIRCHATISRKGKIHKNLCFYTDRSRDRSVRRFRNAIGKAVRRARLQPALMNGEAVRVVDFKYTVVFRRKDGNESITVYPSHLREKTTLGLNYSAAQRYHSWDLWHGCQSRGVRLWIALPVDERGFPGPGRVLSSEDPTGCGQKFLRNLRASRFIPAMKDGSPVASVYTLCFSNRGRPINYWMPGTD